MAGTTRHGVARLNTDGTLDAAFVPPTTGAIGSGVAGDMMFYQMGPVSLEGGLYIFGEFQPANQPRATALRLRPDGSVDGSFRVATDFQINTGAVQPDGRLIIRGQFTTVNDVARGNPSRLNSDGSLDATWQSASTGGGVGVPLSLLPDGKLLAGSRRYFTGSGSASASAELEFTLKAGGLELSWPSGYQLQRTTSLSPADWRDLVTTSPFTAPLTGPGEFYRLKKTP